jgi:hypothetical protein
VLDIIGVMVRRVFIAVLVAEGARRVVLAGPIVTVVGILGLIVTEVGFTLAEVAVLGHMTLMGAPI